MTYIEHVRILQSNHLINLWFPSKCHKLFGPATEYCLLLWTLLCMALTAAPAGSEADMALLTLSRLTLMPVERSLKQDKSIVYILPKILLFSLLACQGRISLWNNNIIIVFSCKAQYIPQCQDLALVW